MAGETSQPISPGASHTLITMKNPVFNVTGRGGNGQRGGKGGDGGDIHNHYNSPESPDTFLLMALPCVPHAAHNSGREDAPSPCLEGTRVAILEEIASWSESANGGRPPVYWLSGLAGIGKSTIAKTVAERAEGKRILGASFFFSRSDRPLRDPSLVLPTLAFQLIHSRSAFKEAFKDLVVEALSRDPTVGRKDLWSQLQELILVPLLSIHSPPHPVLIILDALDECEEKGAARILSLVFKHLAAIPFLRILITSRPEPHLSSVFNEAPNLAKTVLHDIEASVIQQDIHLYISTELARISLKFNLAAPGNWPTDAERNSLVEKCGKLFVYAATAIRFIGDDRARNPRRYLRLLLDTESLRKSRVMPYSHLDDLYVEVLRNSRPPYNDGEILTRFQIIVGSIVVLREPLPLHSLANFVQYGSQVVEASLSHLHSVIIPPSNVHEAPRIYHPSFLEFITDPSRCSMPEFVIVPKPEQELRHALRSFELMAIHLKYDVAGFSDPSLLNEEVDGFAEKVRNALSPEVQYACRYWASHLLCVEFGEERLVEALERFSKQSILWWFEAMSLLGSVSNAVKSIEEVHRWAKSSKCGSSVVRILSDSRRFILAHAEVIRGSALHVYHSALPFTPYDTALYKAYCEDGKDSIKVVRGMGSEWPQHLSTLRGHRRPVWTVAFSPDGSRLASGSGDSTVHLWDGICGASIAKLKGHSSSIRMIAFSPDGLRLASCSEDCTVRLWDGISGTFIAKSKGHSHPVRMIAFSPNGLRLASGSKDCTVCLWDGISGASIAKLKGHSRSIQMIAFSPDGLRLASASLDDTPCLWDATSGASIAELKGHSDSAWTVAFSPDGLHLASGSWDHTVRLWDGISGMAITELKGHSNSVRMVAFSPDGLRLASASLDHTACLWDATSGASIAELKGHSDSVWTVAFSPDGSCLASGSWDNTVCLWDAIPSMVIAELKGHSNSVQSAAFSPGGYLPSGSENCTEHLWDGRSSTPITKLEGHSDSVCAVAFSPDGSYLASGSEDCTVCLWDSGSGTPIAKLEGHSKAVRTIAFSPDGLHLASGSLDCTVCLWDVRPGTLIAKLEGHAKLVKTIAFSPNGLCLASASNDQTVCLWDGRSGASIAKLEGGPHLIQMIAFSSDGCSLSIHTLWETFTLDLTSQLSYHLLAASHPAISEPSVGLTPSIWSLHGQWVAAQKEDSPFRYICYIPQHHTPITELVASSQQTHTQIAFGCMDGCTVILTVPHSVTDLITFHPSHKLAPLDEDLTTHVHFLGDSSLVPFGFHSYPDCF